MLHIVKTLNLFNKRSPVLCGLLFAAVLAFRPISAQAQCATWDASGDWHMDQEDLIITLKLQQKGMNITGSASHSRWYKAKNSPHIGTVEGTIDGDRFKIQIYWLDGLVGVYIGKFRPAGRLEGDAYEKQTPNIRVTWHSQELLKCAPTGSKEPFKITYKVTPPSTPSPPPIRSTGKARNEPAPPPPTPPFIIASHAIIPTPSHPFGIVPVSWDAGPDNPNVQVFVSVDNSPEIPAFSIENPQQSPVWKQPKMGFALNLQRYHSYKFFLRDSAGKTLSTTVLMVVQ